MGYNQKFDPLIYWALAILENLAPLQDKLATEFWSPQTSSLKCSFPASSAMISAKCVCSSFRNSLSLRGTPIRALQNTWQQEGNNTITVASIMGAHTMSVCCVQKLRNVCLYEPLNYLIKSHCRMQDIASLHVRKESLLHVFPVCIQEVHNLSNRNVTGFTHCQGVIAVEGSASIKPEESIVTTYENTVDSSTA